LYRAACATVFCCWLPHDRNYDYIIINDTVKAVLTKHGNGIITAMKGPCLSHPAGRTQTKNHPQKLRVILFYPNIFFKSSSGVLIGVILYFSTRTCSTFGEINAGSVGPK
jgi:hypothetical protein